MVSLSFSVCYNESEACLFSSKLTVFDRIGGKGKVEIALPPSKLKHFPLQWAGNMEWHGALEDSRCSEVFYSFQCRGGDAQAHFEGCRWNTFWCRKTVFVFFSACAFSSGILMRCRAAL